MQSFFDPWKHIEKHGTDLPHWQQGEVMQFVTFRLGDSLPASKLQKWSSEQKVWLSHHPEPWDGKTSEDYHQRFTRRMEDWLDQGFGSCLLSEKGNRKLLEECLMQAHGERVEHDAWVIMPNHVHLLFVPRAPLDDLIKVWKGVSARRIGQGSIWQRNYRDTLIRDGKHYCNAVRYIRRNPLKLQSAVYTLWQSERARKV